MYNDTSSSEQAIQDSINKMALGDVAGTVTLERKILSMPEGDARRRLHEAFESKAQPLISAILDNIGGFCSPQMNDFQERVRARTGNGSEYSLMDMIADETLSGYVRRAAQGFPKVYAPPVVPDRGCEDEEDEGDFGPEGSDDDIVRQVMDDEEVQRVVGRCFLRIMSERGCC